MKPKKRIQEMTFAALLTAIAILIPSIMPIKLIIPPASYTLGSHVPIFLAMFISPWVTAFVILGITKQATANIEMLPITYNRIFLVFMFKTSFTTEFVNFADY